MVNFLGEIKDFIVSVGTETLKEKGKTIYNEKQIKNELVAYTDRELKKFENIDRTCEIDFEKLKIFIIKNLIGEFRETLYGDGKKREQRKKSMLERLYFYAQADSYKKRKYVEKIFFNAYDIIENYYYTYIVKAEYVYLANKIVDDVHEDMKRCLEHLKSESQDVSSVQNQLPTISMTQYGEKNQQIGQVVNLKINNE